MRLCLILSFLLCTLAVGGFAQTCRNRPRNPSCVGARNVGRRCRFCLPSRMWYYDARTRQCHEMIYLGVRGNNNRWCTRASCEQRCRR